MFKPDIFIPIGFLLWNLGDLAGRVICGWEKYTVLGRPKVLAVASIARLIFLPLYAMCNVKGQGSVVDSDMFYWLVQLLFGVTNGWVGSNVMMATPTWVGEDEREASGGFMGEFLPCAATSSGTSLFTDH
jgi:equilibrative nucleoside transporter 1/2/3